MSHKQREYFRTHEHESFAGNVSIGGTLTVTGAATVASYPMIPIPIGGIYLSTTGVNPATELGYGTWTQVAQGLFLVGEA